MAGQAGGGRCEMNFRVGTLRNRTEDKQPASGSGPGTRLGLLLAVCCVSQFMVILDLSIVNVALPSLQSDLGFTPVNLQWVVDAYAIVFAGFLMLGGRASDRFGPRRMLAPALVLFAFASLAGGAATGQAMLSTAPSLHGLSGGLMVLVYGIVEAGTHGWDSPLFYVPLIIAVAMFVLFGVIETRWASAPLVPFKAITKPLANANTIVFVFSAALFPMWFVSSLYLQEVLGLPPLNAGLAFLPMALTIMLVARQAGKLVGLFGLRAVLTSGLVLLASGLLLFARIGPTGSSIGYIVLPGVLTAAGIGLSVVASTIAATQSVKPAQAGLASGLVNTSKQAGGRRRIYPSAPPPGPPIGAYVLKDTHHYVSAPRLHPPIIRPASRTTGSPAPGYILTGNFYDLSKPPMTGQSGPLILDNNLQPVWFRPVPTNVVASDLDEQTYHGQPVLTWWQGVVTNTGQTSSGEYIVVNEHYKTVATLHGADGWVPTLHTMVIDGDNAWVTANKNVPMNLSKWGGVYNGTLVDSAVQEYNPKTGEVIRS